MTFQTQPPRRLNILAVADARDEDVAKEGSSRRFLYTRPDDLALLREEQGFIAHVDRCLRWSDDVLLTVGTEGKRRELIAACIWYCLDHGLPITLTTPDIEERHRKELVAKEPSLETGAEVEVETEAAVGNTPQTTEDSVAPSAVPGAVKDETGEKSATESEPLDSDEQFAALSKPKHLYVRSLPCVPVFDVETE